MRKTIRIISLLVILTTFLLAFSGCSRVKANISSSMVNSSSVNTNAEKLFTDNVEDMGGYEFTIATPWMREKVPANGTLFERLFHQRMTEVEKEYNCKIKIVNFYGNMEGMIPKMMAGDKIADVIQMIADMYLPAAGAGYLRSWDSVSDIIHLNDTRWLSDYNATAINGKHYVIGFERPGDIGSILWYNKNLVKSSGIVDDPAQLALDGKWTWEKFSEMLKSTTLDTNNDGKKDVFGMISNNNYLDVAYSLAASNDASLVKVTDDKLIPTYTDQKFIDALNFYDKLVNTDKTVKIYENMTSDLTWANMPSFDTVINEFRSGKVAFMSGRLWNGNQQLRPFITNFDYGMVVYPKGPSAKDYISNGQVLGGFAMTVTNSDYIKSAKIFNALARPVSGYDEEGALDEEVQKDFFQENDTLSYKMYLLATKTVKVDMGYGVTTLYTGMDNNIAQSIFWRFNTPAAAISGMEGIYDADIINSYAKLPK